MPGPEQEKSKMPELPDDIVGGDEGLSRSDSPDWGGVDLSLGDNADATGGTPEGEDPAN